MKKCMAVACAASFAALLLVLMAAAGMEYRKIQTEETGSELVTEIVSERTAVEETGRQPETEEETSGAPENRDVSETPPAAVLELDGGTELLLAGDICIQDYIAGYYEEAGIGGIVSMELRAKMLTADIMMANQEFVFSERGEPMEDKQFTFRAAPRYVSMLTDMGIDIVSLANNHAMDYGREALADCFPALDNAGIRYVGAGENYERAKRLEIIESGGKKVGILAASRVIPLADWNAGAERSGMFTAYDPAALLQEIREGKEKCDVLVVYVHWGEERAEFPEEYQVTMAHQYIDAGADAVIGAHPHVMQGIEYYKDRVIAYSLGNYIFSPRTGDTALFSLKLKEDGTQEARLIPVDASSFPVDVMPYRRQEEFFRYIESISFGISIDEAGRICYTQDSE